jgi:hypothetical protein
MKVIRIISAVLAALWGLALIPKLFHNLSHSEGTFAASRFLGSLAAILLATAISITLFRSAFKK